MSSFIMNSGSYGDPKFEEYAAVQSGYHAAVHHGAAAVGAAPGDYYGHPHAYSGYPSPAAVGYNNSRTPDAAAAAAAAATMGGYSGYYQQCAAMPGMGNLTHQMAAVSAGHLSSMAANAAAAAHLHGGHGGGGGGGGSGNGGTHGDSGSPVPLSIPLPLEAGTPGGGGGGGENLSRSPSAAAAAAAAAAASSSSSPGPPTSGTPNNHLPYLSSSTTPTSQHGGNGVSPLNSHSHANMGTPPMSASSLPLSVPLPNQLTPGTHDGGLSSDCSDDEISPSSGDGGGGQMPVVYPWMKKIHVAGAGKKTTATSMHVPSNVYTLLGTCMRTLKITFPVPPSTKSTHHVPYRYMQKDYIL